MRPQISQLIRSTIYPSLRDHPRVAAYPHVPGMLADVFFLDHDHPEGGAEEGSSKRNEWEARFVVALARHLTLQVGASGRERRSAWLPEVLSDCEALLLLGCSRCDRCEWLLLSSHH